MTKIELRKRWEKVFCEWDKLCLAYKSLIMDEINKKTKRGKGGYE